MPVQLGGETSSLGVKAEQLAQDWRGTMPKSYDTATVELAMTLSTLAYVDENRIASQEQMISEINAGLEEAGYMSWQVAWGPALNADRSNLLYAAWSSETGQLAVSIRGSDFSFWLNWLEDLATIRLPCLNNNREQVLFQICRRRALNAGLGAIRPRSRIMMRSRCAESPCHWPESGQPDPCGSSQRSRGMTAYGVLA